MWIKSRILLFCALTVASFSHAVQGNTKPPPWQVEGFWAALNDENPKVMVAAIDNTKAIHELPISLHELFISLGERAKNASPRLVELLRDPDATIRESAATALGAMGSTAKEQIPELAKLLRDPDAAIRESAAEALRAMSIATQEQIPELAKLLRDPDA